MNLVDQLTEKFNLTKNEAIVYSTLLTLQTARASDITKNCNVPRTKLYEITKSLHRKGFIEIIPDRVIKFRPVPFERAFDTFIEEQQKKVSDLKESKNKMKDYIQTFFTTKKRDENAGGFTLYKSRRIINKKIREMITQTKENLFLVVDSSDLNQLSYLISNLKKKRIAVKILTPIKKDNLNIIGKWHGKFLLRDFTEMTLKVVINENEVFVFHTEEPSALHSKDTKFISLIKNFFNLSWELSINAEDRIKEITTGKSVEQIKFVRGRENYYNYFKEMIRNAKEDVIIVTSSMGLVRMYKNILDLIKTKTREGVKIKCVIPINNHNIGVAKKLSKIIEIRHTDKVHVAMVCADRNAATMGYVQSDVPTLKSEKDLDILTNNKNMVSLIYEMSQSAWEQAIGFQDRIRELETGKPVEETRILRGRENWYKIFPKVLKKTKKDVIFLIPENAIVRLSKYARKEFEDACNRGIRFRFMVPITKNNLESIKVMSECIEVRHVDNVYIAYTCFDDFYVTIAQKQDESLKFDSKDEIIFTTNQGIIKMSRKLLEDIWNYESVEMEKRIMELETGTKMEEINIIRGQKEVYDNYIQMNKNVQKEVCSIGTEKSIERAKKYGIMELNKINTQHGVKIRAILPIDKENLANAKELMKYSEVRHIDFSPAIRLTIFDDKNCIIRHGGERAYELSKNFSIHSNAKDLIISMKGYFESRWKKAQPAEERIKELES